VVVLGKRGGRGVMIGVIGEKEEEGREGEEEATVKGPEEGGWQD